MPGTLFVVATPIGNLEDLTFRALRVLGEVDLIAAEDTRRTAKLLARYDVRKPVVSLREHNEARETPRLVARLHHGESIALVSDAGTPGIADPGARLVREVRASGIPVVSVPGPSAISAALSLSGIDAVQFVFMGFPPSSGSDRTRWFEQLSEETRTIVFLESPHRIRKTLEEAIGLVKRPIHIAREITKKHENYVICTNTSEMNALPEKGEFTVVIEPAPEGRNDIDRKAVYTMFSKLFYQAGFDDDDAVALVACAMGIGRNRTKNIIRKESILVKQRKT